MEGFDLFIFALVAGFIGFILGIILFWELLTKDSKYYSLKDQCEGKIEIVEKPDELIDFKCVFEERGESE